MLAPHYHPGNADLAPYTLLEVFGIVRCLILENWAIDTLKSADYPGAQFAAKAFSAPYS